MAIRQKKLLTQLSGVWAGSFTETVLEGNAVVVLADGASSSGSISSSEATYHGSAVDNSKQLFSISPGGSSSVFVTGWVMPNVPGGFADVAVSMSGAGSFGDGITGVWGLEIDDLGDDPTVIVPTDGSGSHYGTGTSLNSTSSVAATADGYAFAMQVAFGATIVPEGSPWTAVDVLMSDQFGSASYMEISEGDTVAYSATAESSANWVSAVAIVLPTQTSSLEVTTSSLQNGSESSVYSQTLSADNGVAPYTWSVSSGSLPDGLSLSSSGVISGTPTGTGTSTFTVEVTDNVSATATASLSIAISSTAWQHLTFSDKTTSSGVDTWSVTTSINGTDGQTVRVLPPTSPADLSHSILIVLPANATDSDPDENGFDLLNGLDANNVYNMTVIASTYSIDPCHANSSTDSTRQNETYDLELIQWALANYGDPGDKVYVIGWSKSGLGGQALLFRNPTVITKAASWDFPAEIQDVAGTDPVASGGVWSSLSTIMITNYGSGSTGTSWFQENYELSPENLAAWVETDPSFATTKRSWVGGSADFASDLDWYKTTALPGVGILADTSWEKADSHAWHTDWMTDALEFFVGASIDFNPLMSAIII
jgi:hypothetical protein